MMEALSAEFPNLPFEFGPGQEAVGEWTVIPIAGTSGDEEIPGTPFKRPSKAVMERVREIVEQLRRKRAGWKPL